MKINRDPMVLDAPDLFGRDRELYLALMEQGAGKDLLTRVERAMKNQPKPIRHSLIIPKAKRKPMKSLEDRLWERYRTADIEPLQKGRLSLNGDNKDVPLPLLFAFVTLLEESGRFQAESKALVCWQIAVLMLLVKGELEVPTFEDLDEKAASQQIYKFVKGVMKLAALSADS